MIDYRLALAERGTTGLGAVILSDVLNTIGTLEKAGLTYAFKLNEPGTLEFSLPIDHDDVTRDNFDVGNREVHLYRNEVLWWTGKIWVADVQNWEVRFMCYDFLYDFQKRYIDDDYAEVKDQFVIARDLVRYSQGLDGNPWGKAQRNFGVSTEAGTSGVMRSVVVCPEERMTVFDALSEMSQAEDGFDFWVTPDKTFKMTSPMRTRATTLTFSGEYNLAEVGHKVDGEEMYNDMTIVGPDDDDCAIPLIISSFDATNRTKYGLLEGDAELDSGADTRHKPDKDFLEKVADEALRVSKDPRWQPTTDAPTDLSLALPATGVDLDEVDNGDVVTLETTRGPIGGFGRFNRQFRIIGINVQVDPPGIERWTADLDSALPEEA